MTISLTAISNYRFCRRFWQFPCKTCGLNRHHFLQSRRFCRQFCRCHRCCCYCQHKKRHLQFSHFYSARLVLRLTPAAIFVKTCGLENLLAILPCQAEAAKPATSATKPACNFRALTDKTCVKFVSISAANWHAAARHSKKKHAPLAKLAVKFAIPARLFYFYAANLEARAAWPIAP